MWEPDPSWRPLVGAAGPSSAGVWRAESEGHGWIVKRLTRPGAGDPVALADARHPGYWRREAEVAAAPDFVAGPGVVPARFGAVEEDDAGVTLWTEEVTGSPPTGLQVARCLGRFAAAAYDEPVWASRSLLRRRLELTEERGGWRTLARTTLADVTERLWERRGHWLTRLEEVPLGRLHGDAVPPNFLAVRAEEVVATDWQCVGVGPVGSDLGYWSLSSREEPEVLLEAFTKGARGVPPEQVALAARVTAVYSVLSRAEWALAQAARGEGALAGKFRHPAVAPYVRAVQRQFPQLEALLGESPVRGASGPVASPG